MGWHVKNAGKAGDGVLERTLQWEISRVPAERRGQQSSGAGTGRQCLESSVDTREDSAIPVSVPVGGAGPLSGNPKGPFPGETRRCGGRHWETE